jgi:hypothetical protein
MENTAKGPSLAEVLEGHFPLTSNRLLLQDITNIRQRRILAVVLAPHVLLDRAAIDPLVGILRSLRGTNAIDLYVDGQGPTSPEAWRVVSALREHFERFTSIVPFAASAGATMLALGGDELLMTDVASLSPLEPWSLSPELQRLRGELRALSPTDRAAAMQRLDLRDVGAVDRAYNGLEALVRRILGTHLAAEKDSARVDAICRQLCEGDLLPSFPFTRRDCEQRLQLDVIKPEPALTDNLWKLHEYYRQMFDIEGDWVWNERHFSISYDGFIDTLDERRVLVRIHRLDERGRRIGEGPVLTRWVRPGGQEVVIDRELAL